MICQPGSFIGLNNMVLVTFNRFDQEVKADYRDIEGLCS